MAVVMGWVAARYYVIVVPAVVMLSVRIVEIKWPQKSFAILRATFLTVLVASAALAYADYNQAETSRLLLRDLDKAGFKGGERHFYTGDSFTVSYLKGRGWVPCFTSTQFQVGDQILVKEVTMPSLTFFKKPLELREIAVFNYPTRFPIKVMDLRGSAGFYASVWGALPFTFSTGPWERFHLLEVVGIKEK
jgi:hypothetical protein